MLVVFSMSPSLTPPLVLSPSSIKIQYFTRGNAFVATALRTNLGVVVVVVVVMVVNVVLVAVKVLFLWNSFLVFDSFDMVVSDRGCAEDNGAITVDGDSLVSWNDDNGASFMWLATVEDDVAGQMPKTCDAMKRRAMVMMTTGTRPIQEEEEEA